MILLLIFQFHNKKLSDSIKYYTGNSGYIHWNGGGYIETVDITKYVASSKENGNTGNSGYIH